MVRRLRRMETSTAETQENVESFQSVQRKRSGFREKNRNVSEIDKAVDGRENIINRIADKVYDLNEGARRAAPGVDLEDGAGRGVDPRPAEPEKAPVRREGGRDDGPVPPERLEAGWLSGEPLPARPAAEWIAGGTEQAAVEAEQTFGRAAPVIPAAEWIAGGETPARIPAEEPRASVPPASEEMRWAEQADRAFRRDSRRYDGGFYLY